MKKPLSLYLKHKNKIVPLFAHLLIELITL